MSPLPRLISKAGVFASYLELNQSSPIGSKATGFCTQLQHVKLEFLPAKERLGMWAVPGRGPETSAVLTHGSDRSLGIHASQIVTGFWSISSALNICFWHFVQFYTFFVEMNWQAIHTTVIPLIHRSPKGKIIGQGFLGTWSGEKS